MGNKTVMIFDQCAEAPIQFIVLEGDYIHLDGVYINSIEDENKQQELSDLLYTQDGQPKVNFLKTFPIDAVRNGASVIVTGFIP